MPRKGTPRKSSTYTGGSTKNPNPSKAANRKAKSRQQVARRTKRNAATKASNDAKRGSKGRKRY